MKTDRLMTACPYDAPAVRVTMLDVENPCLAGSEYGAAGAAGDYSSDYDHNYSDEF